jgi:hypothetical protein
LVNRPEEMTPMVETRLSQLWAMASTPPHEKPEAKILEASTLAYLPVPATLTAKSMDWVIIWAVVEPLPPGRPDAMAR